MTRLISTSDRFDGERATLRLVTLADCNERYVAWLADPEVNQYLETRFRPQPLSAIRDFVSAMLEDPASYLLAIVDRADGAHVGNIKLGPVNPHHSYCDVSYFIGERDRWGRGLATDAIRTATRIGFARLALHRVQAGVYSGNQGSVRALLKVGYRAEGSLREQLRGRAGWEDHLWYGFLRQDWPNPEEIRDERPTPGEQRTTSPKS